MKNTKHSKLLYSSDCGDGSFINPVTFMDMSDPDAIAFGDFFYMTCSSFNYTPGLPIWRSADMVNWELISYALTELPDSSYRQARHSCGVWAPSLRFHNGLFYIYFAMPDEGIYCVCSEDIEGRWTKPVKIFDGKGYIDPCPYFSDKGNYLIHAYAKSRYGSNSKLALMPLSEDGLRVTGEDLVIFDGNGSEPTIEGPKVYSRNGYIYIWAPAGGVPTGWQCVLRSKNIEGPYEIKHVLSQGTTDINGPHQGALVSDCKAEDWFLHFQATPAHGRILRLEPVCWLDDWPIIGNQGEPVSSFRKPAAAHKSNEFIPSYPDGSDSFKESRINPLWQSPANVTDFYSLTAKGIELPTHPFDGNLFKATAILTQPVLSPRYKVTVQLDFSGLLPGENAGLAILGAEYRAIGISVNESGRAILTEFSSEEGLSEIPSPETYITDNSEKSVSLSIYGDESGAFGMSISGESFCYTPNSELSKLPYSLSGHQWVGARICLFAEKNKASQKSGYALFSDFVCLNKID